MSEVVNTKNEGRIGPGAAVVVVLHSPKEKCWGVLDEISASGVFLRSLLAGGGKRL